MLLYEDNRSPVCSLAFSPDGAFLASGAKDGVVVLRGSDGSTQPLFDPGPKHAPVHALSFHPDQPAIAVGWPHGWTVFRQEPDGLWRPSGPGSPTRTTDLAFLDRSTLAVGVGERGKATAGRFELWDFPTGRRIEPVFDEPNGVQAVAVSRKKKFAAWATSHRMVCAWNIQKPDRVKFPQKNNCTAVAIAPDGVHLAVAADWTVRLFDVEKQRERTVLKAHKGQVSSLAFSPDGTTLATGSWDQTVRLWDVATGRERETFQWSIGRIYRLAYAPDGLRLAAGSDTGAVLMWDTE